MKVNVYVQNSVHTTSRYLMVFHLCDAICRKYHSLVDCDYTQLDVENELRSEAHLIDWKPSLCGTYTPYHIDSRFVIL